jgi:hypothetical protein
MKTSGVARLAVALLVAWAPLTAYATALVPVSQTRSVSASVDADPGDPSSVFEAASDFGTFFQTATAIASDPNLPGYSLQASITQNSFFEDARISVSMNGTVFAYGVGGTASVQSIFDVTFDLTVPSSAFIISGFFSNGGSYQMSLTDPDGVVLATQSGAVGGNPFMLDPGRYRLSVQLDKSNPGVNGPDGSFSAFTDFSVTPIPEAGTAGLLALGLCALASRRESRTRRLAR